MDEARASGEAAALHARNKAGLALGIVLERAGPGSAQLSMTVRDDMLNPHGTAHGGVIFTLADTAFGYASNIGRPITVSLCADISFLVPARAGDVLRALAQERSTSGRTGVYDVTVVDQAGALVALFRGTAYRLGEGRAQAAVPTPGGAAGPAAT